MLGPSSPWRSSVSGWAGLGPRRGTDGESLLTRSSRPPELGASQQEPAIIRAHCSESQQGPAVCAPPGLCKDTLPGHSSQSATSPYIFPSVSARGRSANVDGCKAMTSWQTSAGRTQGWFREMRRLPLVAQPAPLLLKGHCSVQSSTKSPPQSLSKAFLVLGRKVKSSSHLTEGRLRLSEVKQVAQIGVPDGT